MPEFRPIFFHVHHGVSDGSDTACDQHPPLPLPRAPRAHACMYVCMYVCMYIIYMYVCNDFIKLSSLTRESLFLSCHSLETMVYPLSLSPKFLTPLLPHPRSQITPPETALIKHE